ncbi:MAG: class I SAM-dependent methyltransferase [Candidatus Rokubacteria bacterium]|nr:class I SAM-dependent methyltransferase [Candidatus Rokubacteria bacterium]
MAPRAPLISSSSATEQFLARLGCDREEFLRGHFAAAWGWYERLTSLCTLGRIHAWREECVHACGLEPGDRVLDVATGTGPVLFRAIRALGPSGLAVGLDLSVDGLIDGQAEAAKRRMRAHWVQGRALPLPFRDGSFDAVLVGFALRHLGAPHEVLPELRRVLVPGGRLGIVDFVRPWAGLMSWAGLAYLFWVVPLVSGLLSRRRAVYRLARYLPHSILDALRPEQLAHAMGAAGFALEGARPLCAGIVWLFTGRATVEADDTTAASTALGVPSSVATVIRQ